MFGKLGGPALLNNRPQPTVTREQPGSDTAVIRHNKNKQIHKQRRKREANVSRHLDESELRGAKFRLLNEMLYSSTSEQALQYFTENKEDFELYHNGYRHQSTKWQTKPVDQIIAYLLKHANIYRHKVIADLGCGEGFIEQTLTQHGFSSKNMRSYDLVQTKPFIRVADIAHLPRKKATVDLCIFCLSLMGSNYLQFIRQARRILKTQGQLIISQVESRCPDWPKFTQMVEQVGFKLINNRITLENSQKVNKEKSIFFRTMLFQKQQTSNEAYIFVQDQKLALQQASRQLLTVCTYKKR